MEVAVATGWSRGCRRGIDPCRCSEVAFFEMFDVRLLQWQPILYTPANTMFLC